METWETSADLLWPQNVITYGRMRHDPQIRAVLNAYFLPILRANWALDPSGCKQRVVQQCADDLGVNILGKDSEPGPARRRGVIWRRHLRLALDHLVFGHMPFEIRYRVDGSSPGDCHLDHLGERLPWTIAAMIVKPDGTLAEIKQNTQDKPIPGNRLLWYVNGQAGANWAGVSLLRPAYGPWLLKHEMWRVHGTSIRRWGMGVPQVAAPPGATAAQVAEAQQMASAMRGGDQAGIGLPSGYVASILGMTGTAPDALGFIEYLDRAVAKMALAGLIELGQTETGSRALGETFLDLFLLSLQAVADEVATTATSGQDGMPGIIVDLVTQNWGEDEPAPRLVCTDVGNNYQLAADSLQALMAAGAITADPNLEKWVRETWRLPEREPSAGPPAAPASPGGIAQRAVPGESPPAPGLPAGHQAPALPPGRGAKPGQGGVAAAAAPPGLRRGYTALEQTSGFDAAAHDAAWVSGLDALTGVYRDVLRTQRNDLVDQVIAAVGDGHPERAVRVPDTRQGAQVIASAMTITARQAAAEAVAEAAHQGVGIDPARVRIDEVAVARQARMWAGVIAQRMVQAAAVRAASATAANPLADQASTVGDMVDQALGELSDTRLREELGGALSSAQNTGRMAAFAAAPDEAGTVSYVASEILDSATCEPCKAADGALFANLAQAQQSYPAGHYLWCKGQLRCRGTVVAVWHEPPLGVAAAAWREELHPRDRGGQFTHSPGGGAPGVAGFSEDYVPPRTDTWMPDLLPARGVKALTSRGRAQPPAKGTPDDPVDVNGDLDKALHLMYVGQHVRLNQPDEITLLMERVNKLAAATRAKGRKPPLWDFGKLTVRGTNLFTAQSRGIPRIYMPQFSGLAQPGTPAATKAGGAGKFVDLGDEFGAKLRAEGVAVHRRRVKVSHLRATQMEIDGAKVAGFAQSALDPANPRHREAVRALAEPIYITRDHYVIDGHHRWAANMVVDSADGVLGNDTWQNVTEIDMDIGAAIPYALGFAEEMGIATRAVGAAALILAAAVNSAEVQESFAAAWQESKHLRDKLGRWADMPGGGHQPDVTSGKMQAGDWQGGYQAVGQAPVHILGTERKRSISVPGQKFTQAVDGSWTDPWWMTNASGGWAISRRWVSKAQTGYDWSGGGRAKTFPIPAMDERVLTPVDMTGNPLGVDNAPTVPDRTFPDLHFAVSDAETRARETGHSHYITKDLGREHFTVTADLPPYGNHYTVTPKGEWSREAGPGTKSYGGYRPNVVKMDGPPTVDQGDLLADDHPLNQQNAAVAKLDEAARKLERAADSAHELYVMALRDASGHGQQFDPASERAQLAEQFRREWMAAKGEAAKARGKYQAALVAKS